MTKDYAKKHKRRRSRKKKAAPGWLWLVAGLSIGALLVGLYVLNSQHARPTKKTTHALTKAQKKPTTPEFDFYTILPKIQAPVIAAQPSSSKEAKSTAQYILQIASVRKYTDADRLKAELTLLGFNVFIQKYKAGKDVWNRVNVGPYNSRSAAESDQKRLYKNEINNILLQVKRKT